MPRRLARAAAWLAPVVLVLALTPPVGATQDRAEQAAFRLDHLDPESLAATRQAVARRMSAAGWAAAHAGDGEVVEGSLLVTVRASATGTVSGGLLAAADALASGHRGSVLRVRTAAGEEAETAARLLARDDVLAVEPNRVLRFSALPDDPAFPDQFAHELTDAPAAWDVVTDASDVLVALLDSGVVAEHPDLAGQVVEQHQVLDGDVVEGSADNDRCKVGHGTWTAGIMGALGDNGLDVSGAAWRLSILDVNVSATEQAACEAGSVTEDAIVAGIDFARGRGADIINMSLGGRARACSVATQTAVDEARAAGITLIAASGNSSGEDVAVPASCNGVISVSAVGPSGETASYASTSPYVDLTAPSGDSEPGSEEGGVLTTSWWQGGRRTRSVIGLNGTSFSAPYVSGVAALMLAVDPALEPDDVEGVLEATAEDVNEPGRDAASGWGLVQAGAALQRVDRGGPYPTPEADPDFPVGGQAGARPGGTVEVGRISAGATLTEPVSQAVAVSQTLFEDAGATEGPTAAFAVLARADDFADALAGSSITFGAAPVLYTAPSGPMDPATLAELERVVPSTGGIIILGGRAAVSAEAEQQLRSEGFLTQRLFGPTREETAVAVMDELLAVYDELGPTGPPAAILANRSFWFDAITSGNLAAPFRLPVLLTGSEELHPATEEALGRLSSSTLYVVGGETRVPTPVIQQARAALDPDELRVLKGAARDGTAVAVAGEVERLLDEEFASFPELGIVFNLSREDGYAHALSMAPLLAATDSVYLPLLGDDGSELSDVLRGYDQGLGIDVVLAGGRDVLSMRGAETLREVLEEPPP